MRWDGYRPRNWKCVTYHIEVIPDFYISKFCLHCSLILSEFTFCSVLLSFKYKLFPGHIICDLCKLGLQYKLYSPFKDEEQTALFEEPVRTAQ